MGVQLVFKHYSQDKPLTCKVVSGDLDKFCSIQLPPEVNIKPLHRGDPILIGVKQSNDTVNAVGGYIVSINYDLHSAIITSDNVIYTSKDKLEMPKQSVSLLGNITNENLDIIRHEVIVKDISYSTIRIYSEDKLEVNDTVQIDIIVKANVLSFEGRIARYSHSYDKIEYGLELIHRDKVGIMSTKDTFEKLLTEEHYSLQKQFMMLKEEAS